ncbi:MAG: cell division protein FtsA [Chitinophagales bacterium]|nr:cell division protein FtsA [Chitinophagales bacterium]
METSEYIVGLDIGTTKICAIVAKRNEFGKIQIEGIGTSESFGVSRGVVANIDKTVDAIKKAVKEAEDNSGVDIKSVYVGIAGQHIKSLQHRGILVRDNVETEISKEDIRKLTDDMRKLVVNPGDRIIHVLPQEFLIDSEPGIKEPVGMCGVRLEANFHIITGQISAAQNIKKCVEKAGLVMEDMILEPLASASAVLSLEEKDAGVALVDIGGGTTDIAIFQDGIIRHTYVIPFGGNVITEDIKDGCMVMKNQAEILKCRFGSAISDPSMENQIVSIPGLRGGEPKEISVRNLANIINARMEEILELVDGEITMSGFKNKLIGGVVVTGGGAHLANLVQLTEYITGLPARIGLPIEHLASSKIEKVKHPMFSTGVGLVLNGFEDHELRKERLIKEQEGIKIPEMEIQQTETQRERIGLVGKLLTGMKDFFAAGIDDDLK